MPLLPYPQIAKWYDNQRAKIKRLERQHVGGTASSQHDAERRPASSETTPGLDSPAQISLDNVQEAEVMRTMAVASSFMEMRQQHEDSHCEHEQQQLEEPPATASCGDAAATSTRTEIVGTAASRSTYGDERGASSEDEVVAASALQLHFQRLGRQRERSTTPPDIGSGVHTRYVSGGGGSGGGDNDSDCGGDVRRGRSRERDENELAESPLVKRGRGCSSESDAASGESLCSSCHRGDCVHMR